MDQWPEFSQITISGWWLGKRIFSVQADDIRPAGWEGLWHYQTSSLSICSQWTRFNLSTHFSPSYFFFFFFAWRVIIHHFSRATICGPSEGSGQFPEHEALPDALRAHTQEPELNSQTYPVLRLQNAVYIYQCSEWDKSPLCYCISQFALEQS